MGRLTKDGLRYYARLCLKIILSYITPYRIPTLLTALAILKPYPSYVFVCQSLLKLFFPLFLVSSWIPQAHPQIGLCLRGFSPLLINCLLYMFQSVIQHLPRFLQGQSLRGDIQSYWTKPLPPCFFFLPKNLSRA